MGGWGHGHGIVRRPAGVCAPHTDNIKLLRLCVCLQMLQIRERAPAVATVSTHS